MRPTVIAKGVTIGDHSIIGACSFVNRSLPPLSIAAGVPCRIIGHVELSDDGDARLVVDGSAGTPARTERAS